MKKSKKVKLHLKLKSKKLIASISLFFILVLISVTFLYFAVQIYFVDKVYPGTYFAGQNLGGMHKALLPEMIKNKTDQFENSIILVKVGNESYPVNISDLGVSYDPDVISSVVFNSGKNIGFKNQIAYLFGKNTVNADYRLDLDKFNFVLADKIYSHQVLPVDSTIVFSDSSPKIQPSKKGYVVDKGAFFKDLGWDLLNLKSRELIVDFIDQEPNVSESQVKRAFEKVSALSKQQLVLSYDYDKWTLSGKNLFDLLSFYPYKQESEHFISLYLGKNPIFIDKVDLDKVANGDLDVSVDDVKFSSYLESISGVINKPTHDATLRFENGKVIEFSSAQDGQVLDSDGAKALILKKLSVDFTQQDSKLLVQLPVKVTKAKIANEQINSLGIKELIGTGVSYFAGSIPNRVSNIALGSGLINGALVKPGEVFSFVGLVGPVSKEQGFKQAYVINSGKTVLDDGGGICQVSTTVFRAALNAGLPIVKRTAHAYRVGYYEQHGFKPGFDATVFSPSVDFQFKNDTDHHILVQTTVDRANARLQIDIYGTLDNRKVELGDAIVSNITPAPEPRYQDDPTLPLGTMKQVDFAASGATSVFTRKVYRGGQLILDDVFRSNFRPWQAVYLVGKG